MSDKSKSTDELLALARAHVEFLRRSAQADASEAGMNTTLKEASRWETAIKKALGER